MNELINNPAVTAALEKAGVAAEVGVQETVKYNAMLGAMQALLVGSIIITLLCCCGWCVYKFRKASQVYGEDECAYVFPGIITGLLALFLSPLIGEGVCRWLNPIGYLVMRLL